MARNKENCLISAALKQDVQHSLKNQTNMIFSEGKSGSITCNPFVGKKKGKASYMFSLELALGSWRWANYKWAFHMA